MTPTKPPARGRGFVFRLAAVALVAVSALTATGLAWLLRPDPPRAMPKGRFPGKLFDGWDEPDFVVVLSGQQHGYVQPCGCSRPQVGGMERRYNLVQTFVKNGWPYAAVDLGDLPQRAGPAGLPNQQGMIKYVYSMKSLKAMGYSAVGFGDYEVNLGLSEALGNYALNDEPKVVSTNLMDADKYYPDQVIPWKPVDVETAKKGKVRLGVVAVTGPTVADKIKAMTRNDAKVRFGETAATLDNVGKQLKASGVALPVLLYQGPMTLNAMGKPSTAAVACAEAYPEYPLVLCATEEDDPSMLPTKVTTKSGTETLLITVGHKGKFIGVVGVWKTGDAKRPFRFRYERVELSEDFLTPAGKEGDHPVVGLMEEYTKKLRDERYLERYGQVRHALQVMPDVKGLKDTKPADYAGSDSCKKCHEEAYAVWKKSGHSHAYDTLVKAKHPSNRQYDPECIVCHTVGFGYQTGYVSEADWARRKGEKKEGERDPPVLRDVGCESCHGPSGAHVRNPNDAEWQKRINPWRHLPKQQRVLAMDQMCQKCHDQDNDVSWLNNGFGRKWPDVKHYTVPEEADAP